MPQHAPILPSSVLCIPIPSLSQIYSLVPLYCATKTSSFLYCIPTPLPSLYHAPITHLSVYRAPHYPVCHYVLPLHSYTVPPKHSTSPLLFPHAVPLPYTNPSPSCFSFVCNGPPNLYCPQFPPLFLHHTRLYPFTLPEFVLCWRSYTACYVNFLTLT